MKKTDVAGIQIHDNREKGYSHSNDDIDFKKSHWNFDLHNDFPVNFTNKIKERIAELDLKRAVRKDANVMAQIFISATPEWLHNQAWKQQVEYFQDAYEWVCNRYGNDNIIAATVHMDEATPHMHVNLVPVTSDGRVSYEAFFNERKRGDLRKLQDDFYKHNQDKGYNLERGERQTDGSKKQHLSVLDFKVQEKKKEIETEDAQLKILQTQNIKLQTKNKTLHLEAQKHQNTASDLQIVVNDLTDKQNALQTQIDANKQHIKNQREKLSNLDGKLKTKDGIDKILERAKTSVTGKLILSKDDVNDLVKTALSSPIVKMQEDINELHTDNKNLKSEIEALKTENRQLKNKTRKVDSLTQQNNKLMQENEKLAKNVSHFSTRASTYELNYERVLKEKNALLSNRSRSREQGIGD